MINRYKKLLLDPSGVDDILREMDRQISDAQATLESQRLQITALADALRERKSALLLGMGASHFANEIFAFQLRKMGIDALAMTASEFLYNPIPLGNRLVVLTSQSGESGETVRCILSLKGAPLYGITLSEDSTVARNTRAILCEGGSERAFAGTRSVTLTLAVMAAVSALLSNQPMDKVISCLNFEVSEMEMLERAIWLLMGKKDIIATGRSLFSPLAGLFALGCEELGTFPVRYNETGTFRHGPMEIVGRDSVLVIFRQSGELGALCESFVELKEKSGCALVVVDASGLNVLDGSVTIRHPEGDDIFAVLRCVQTFQTLMICYACAKNPNTGLPRYSSKITVKE